MVSTFFAVEVGVVGPRGAPARLTYSVPPSLVDGVRRGTCVVVPFGARRLTGVVLGPTVPPPEMKLRDLAEVLPELIIPSHLLDLLDWAATYYQAPYTTLLRALLPPAVVARQRRRIRPTTDGLALIASAKPPLGVALASGDLDVLRRIPEDGISLAQVRGEASSQAGLASCVRRLSAARLVVVDDVSVGRRQDKTSTVVRATANSAGIDAIPARAHRQIEIYRFVVERSGARVTRAELEDRFPACAVQFSKLVQLGVLEEVGTEESPVPAEAGPVGWAHAASPTEQPTAARQLRGEQQVALQAVLDRVREFSTFLLFGITGSGKTEVYLRAADAVLAAGRSVLILVPEIALTHQLVAEVMGRFPARASILHSGLGDADRWRTWRDVAAGRSRLVIGARSAVFAPVRDLGLIVVDEEHDGAYKQDEQPRYNGRDLAVVRGKLAGCPVILASATPALESYQAATAGKYQLLELHQRANSAELPTVEIVDLRQRPWERPGAARSSTASADPGRTTTEAGATGESPLAPRLTAAVVENYRAGEQTLLFLNRRGFSRAMQCHACGHVEGCPDCSVSLTFHRQRRSLICHHCGFARAPAATCPSCGNLLDARGFGTEQLEAAVRTLLPAARIARLDRDTTNSPTFLGRTINAWRHGELDVLVGTQMIAKGHDAPGVTLIGVVLADASLNFPDFRAAEHTFQLLTQVAGRAGRGSRPGRVIVQTYQPDHPSLTAAREHDYRGYAARELEARRELLYPPFGRLIRLVIEGDEAPVLARSQSVARHLRAAALRFVAASGLPSVLVLGPAPAPIERLRGRHRAQILIKSGSAREAARVVAVATAAARSDAPTESTRILINVDPTSML